MSRIGNKHIVIPAGVEVVIEGNKITTKGPKGTLSFEFNPVLNIEQNGNELVLTRSSETKFHHDDFHDARVLPQGAGDPAGISEPDSEQQVTT